MEWWQTLLISLSSSVVTAVIALIVPLVQLKHEKEERKAQYENERKQHISQMRLDMEFDIYKELSEKVVALAVNCLALFDDDFDYSQIKQREATDKDVKLRNKVAKLQNDANESIYKYAIFIPKEWYDKFNKIKYLCCKQVYAYEDYFIFKKLKNIKIDTIKDECEKRNKEISDVFNELVNELRKYIATLDTNSTTKEVAKKTAK